MNKKGIKNRFGVLLIVPTAKTGIIFALIFKVWQSISTLYGHLFYNAGINLDYWNRVKFIIDNIWLLALAIGSGSMLLIPVLQRSGAKVSVLQATQMMNQGKCLVLDVRDAAEFEAGHIKSAKNIPVSELSKRLSELEKQKNFSVITVCASGKRSATASAILTRAAFAQVVSLEGGMAAWQEQGLPTVK
ncbi:rhodanese-related sulfurtransferase [Oxalobacteraceae bacterium GrIS 2.11]